MEIADRLLDFVRKSHDPDRFRPAKNRLEEFVDLAGA
jgi:hypothetical protein